MIKYTLCLALACASFHFAQGQQLPDFSSGDNYLPYVNEQGKRDKIITNHLNSVKRKYPNTSEEIYAYLYKSRNFKLPTGVPDPNKTFPAYLNSVTLKPVKENQPVIQNLYTLNSSITERNLKEIEADIRNYEEKQQQSDKYVSEALEALYSPEVTYNLGLHSGIKVEPFLKAKDVLLSMLNGTQPIDFTKAVYFVESAVDPTLTFEDFNRMLQDGLEIIATSMRKENLSPQDNLAKIFSIYKFMTDTTKVFISRREKVVTSLPMLYDFEDYEAKQDITKVFVSKLLKTGSGQCMSLPTLFFLYAKELNADVNLVFAPEHSFITFRDNKGSSQNIELTGRMFTSTDFYWQSGFIKAEQVKSGIYLKPLNEKEVLVHLMTTLCKAYVRTFGVDERLLEMARLSKEFAPTDLSANMLLFGYYRELHKNVLRQYEVFQLPKSDLDKDEKAKAIEASMFQAYDFLKKDLGYSKMPDWAYKQWLDGVNSLAQKQQHLTRKRQLEHQLRR